MNRVLSTKRELALAGVAVFIVLSLIGYMFGAELATEQPSITAHPAPQASNDSYTALASAALTHPAKTRSDRTDLKTELVLRLRDRLGPTLDNRYTQVHVLEQLMAYLMPRYPDDWPSRLRGMVKEVFPERVDELMALHSQMQDYNAWLDSERQSLQTLNADERRQLLWDMRRSFFGDAVDEIWAEALKNEQIDLALRQLPDDGDFSKLSRFYLNALTKIYRDQAGDALSQQGQELADRFLANNKVQVLLQEMSAQERFQAVADFRRNLGLDELTTGYFRFSEPRAYSQN